MRRCNNKVEATSADVVKDKCFGIVSVVKCRSTHDEYEMFGQGGLLRGSRLTPSPKPEQGSSKRQAVDDGHNRPIIKSSHFKATPVTCLHNVSACFLKSTQSWADFKSATFHSLSIRPRCTVSNFQNENFMPSSASNHSSVVIREAPSGEMGGDAVVWKYGHDVSRANTLEQAGSEFTSKTSLFDEVRSDYSFGVGQKIGIAVYRNFDIDTSGQA